MQREPGSVAIIEHLNSSRSVIHVVSGDNDEEEPEGVVNIEGNDETEYI